MRSSAQIAGSCLSVEQREATSKSRPAAASDGSASVTSPACHCHASARCVLPCTGLTPSVQQSKYH